VDRRFSSAARAALRQAHEHFCFQTRLRLCYNGAIYPNGGIARPEPLVCSVT
jgi:hypothetical protein